MHEELKVEINASVERIWESLVDIENWPVFTSSISSVRRIDQGPFGLGSCARVKQPGTGTLMWSVTKFAPGQFFVWEAKRPGLTLVAGHFLALGDNGRVKLTLTLEAKGLLSRLLRRFIEKSTTKNLRLEAEEHKTCAELPESGH